MIIMIIIISVLILSVIGLIVSSILDSRGTTDLYALKAVSAVFCVLSSIFFIVCGVGCLSVIAPDYNDTIRDKLSKEVFVLNSQYELYSSMEEGYSKYVAIEEYNKNVKDFKKKIVEGQNGRNNVWTSWLYPPVYNEFNENMVSYIDLY